MTFDLTGVIAVSILLFRHLSSSIDYISHFLAIKKYTVSSCGSCSRKRSLMEFFQPWKLRDKFLPLRFFWSYQKHVRDTSGSRLGKLCYTKV